MLEGVINPHSHVIPVEFLTEILGALPSPHKLEEVQFRAQARRAALAVGISDPKMEKLRPFLERYSKRKLSEDDVDYRGITPYQSTIPIVKSLVLIRRM